VPGYVEVAAMPNAVAQIVKGALEAEGLRVMVDREGRDPYGIDSGWFATRVLVEEGDAERARALIAEIEASEL
jgi:hypothetical protein